jgi:hypothetical protein
MAGLTHVPIDFHGPQRSAIAPGLSDQSPIYANRHSAHIRVLHWRNSPGAPHMRDQHSKASSHPRLAVALPFFAGLFIFSILAGTARAQNGDLYIYPAKGQSQEKQDKDRYECHSWAVKQTGVDPSKPSSMAPDTAAGQPYQPSQPHVVKGAARGAALGAVGGAITGSAGKGAAAGAAMGGLAGGFRRRDERRQQSAQQQADVQAAQQNQRIAYNRAMAACLQGRGYTVN